jgi:hypothetical protein
MNAGTKNGEDANQNANVSARVSSDDIEGKTGSQMTKRTTSLRKKRPPRHSKPDTRRRIPIRNHHQHQISGNVRGTRVRRRGSGVSSLPLPQQIERLLLYIRLFNALRWVLLPH